MSKLSGAPRSRFDQALAIGRELVVLRVRDAVDRGFLLRDAHVAECLPLVIEANTILRDVEKELGRRQIESADAAMSDMEAISGGTDKVQKMSSSLARAVSAQSETTGEISMSVTSMHQSTEMSGATIESAAKAIEELAGPGDALGGLIGRVRLCEEESVVDVSEREVDLGDTLEQF